MKRTYRSKKDVGRAVDPRDVFQNFADNSSAFDAFYIQNIKQTKREISCMGSTLSKNNVTIAPKKVRKRKYVRRIVKDVEPSHQSDSLPHSAYLTPDKSIRVNKAFDPFDMLLNSSPVNHNEPRTSNNNSITNILQKKESKTYTRKRKPNKKKINYYSSDETDSEKENKSNSASNVTDIRTHVLVIEKEPIQSPKYLDKSILDIVNTLKNLKHKSPMVIEKEPIQSPKFLDKSILDIVNTLKNLKHKSPNISFNTSYKNKVTKQFHSPILQRSPICSTPFKEKYRGASIYKFSPITQKSHDSPQYAAITEETINKNASQYHVSKDNTLSPIIHLPKCKPSFKNESRISVTANKDIAKQRESGSVQKKEEIGSNTDDIVYDLSTENEPFPGFGNIVSEDTEFQKDNLLNYERILKELSVEGYTAANKIEAEASAYNINDSAHSHNRSIFPNNKPDYGQSSAELENSDDESDSESMYDTCNSEQSTNEENILTSKIPLVIVEKMDDATFFKYYNKMENHLDIDKMSDSMLLRYCNSLDNESRDEGKNDTSDYENYASLETNSKISDDSSSEKLLVSENHLETKSNEILITDSSTTEDISSNEEDVESNYDEYTCVSFVTTRKRNEVPDDSMFILDDSHENSSTDCDKTILSNININTEPPSSNLSANNDRKLDTHLNLSEMNSPDVDTIRVSKVTVRKSSTVRRSHNILCSESDKSINNITLIDCTDDNLNEVEDRDIVLIGKDHVENLESNVVTKNTNDTRDNSMLSIPERSSHAGSEGKQGIVLQPGKKWERSLSIYRRMTMASNFDQCTLEDEYLKNKGRKYRQSVISTMEMQESRDLLHNDSFNSRRSTFVSKPSRPTIRLVRDSINSRVSLNTTSLYDDLKGFLNEECDDTLIEISKLSIAESDHEVTVLENLHETSERIATARDYVLRRCNQTEPILFDECYPETVLKNCRKIGEGVYGEVFLWRGRDGRARVMKIVPIAGSVKVNGEDQKDFHEIISEIVIAMELSALRAPIAELDRQLDEGQAIDLHSVENATDVFNEVLAVRCVYGPYPSRLLDLWELYDECKGSENDNPATLPNDQQYIVLELANAGQDLESFQFASAQQAHALFQQLAFGLAVAEEAYQFEHRDLHWGNVLIAPTDQKSATFVVGGAVHRVARRGVAATIIDYSLSRVSLPLQADSAALYNDLAADDQLFDAVGDYQFQVYRLMRDKLGNDWKNFEPYTNILWLHYTVDKMITALRYKRTNTKIHKHYIEKLKGIKERILEYSSATQFALTDIDF